MDTFSRCAVGRMVAHRKAAALARRLIADIRAKQGMDEDSLALRAARGQSMRSKGVAPLLSGFGVFKTRSRPHAYTGNPCSVAHFKTLKYRPELHARFGRSEDARSFCRDSFSCPRSPRLRPPWIRTAFRLFPSSLSLGA